MKFNCSSDAAHECFVRKVRWPLKTTVNEVYITCEGTFTQSASINSGMSLAMSF